MSGESSSPEPGVTEATSAGTEITVAEPQNTPGDSPMIPKARFDEVIAQRNETREEVAGLRSEIEALKAAAAAGQSNQASNGTQDPTEEPDLPPDGLNQLQQAQWMIEKYGMKALEKRLGMSVDNLKTLLQTAQVSAQDSATRKWQDMCQRHGLDPADTKTQAYVHGLVKNAGMKADDALKEVASLLGRKPNGESSPEPKTATVEPDGVTGVMTGEKLFAWTPKEASDLAHQGKRVTQLSTEEIIARAIEKGRSAK